MAKISARGATKVAEVKTCLIEEDPEYPGDEQVWVLRSDRKVLRRIKYGAGLGTSGFSIHGTLPKELTADAAGLRKYVGLRYNSEAYCFKDEAETIRRRRREAAIRCD